MQQGMGIVGIDGRIEDRAPAFPDGLVKEVHESPGECVELVQHSVTG